MSENKSPAQSYRQSQVSSDPLRNHEKKERYSSGGIARPGVTHAYTYV